MTEKERGRPRDALGLKALIATAPLDGVDLTRPHESSRENFSIDGFEQITSKLEYQRALIEIEAYFFCEPELGTPDALHFDELAMRISAYEDNFQAQANSSE